MSDNYKNYLDEYALSNEKNLKVMEAVSGSSIHVFGATGALGLSFLKLLNIYDVLLGELTLYIRNSSDISEWLLYGEKFGLKIKCIYLDDNFKNLDLSKISASSTILFFLGSAQPQKFMKDPASLFKINVDLLSQIVLKTPKYIFYTSTSEIYSGLRDVAFEGSSTVSTPQHPRGAYIESKRCGEAVLAHLSNSMTRSVAFRVALATPPSPIKDDNRILADLVRMANESKTVSLKGGWDSVRQYQWGPSCVMKMLWAGYFGESNLYNIAGGERITLEDLAKNIAEHFLVKYIDSKENSYANIGAPDFVQVSSSRLEKELGHTFKPEPIRKVLDIYLSRNF